MIQGIYHSKHGTSANFSVEKGDKVVSVGCDNSCRDEKLSSANLFRCDICLFQGDNDVTAEVFGVEECAIVNLNAENMLKAMEWLNGR